MLFRYFALAVAAITPAVIATPAPAELAASEPLVSFPASVRPFCGAPEFDRTKDLLVEQATADMMSSLGVSAANTTSDFQALAQTVNVYFNVISRQVTNCFALTSYIVPNLYFSHHSTTGVGALTDAQVRRQIDVLNADFAGNYFFNLVSINRVTNNQWFNQAGPSTAIQTTMKRTLRKGGAADLNLYSVGFTSVNPQGLLGYATFPSSYRGNPLDDGVVFLYRTVPGGNLAQYNTGRTLTHEVGHWVGLFHTFQGGCSGNGDFVTDTPPQASPSSGCPTGRDTCAGGGRDPISNYVDSCKNTFSPGQYARAAAQLRLYRGFQ
ncbi:hypothetical protein HDU96_000686 [Phlyctochytrium bullatum]|nr:hypothetical protein HDU96_000686 [Phlyctochytrium bullatum]